MLSSAVVEQSTSRGGRWEEFEEHRVLCTRQREHWIGGGSVLSAIDCSSRDGSGSEVGSGGVCIRRGWKLANGGGGWLLAGCRSL